MALDWAYGSDTGNEDISSMAGRTPFARPGGNVKFILLLVPCILALWVPLYNSISPTLFDIPFFFWFQLILVPLSALAILAADRVSKN
jgi:hypothetical protein